MDRRTASVVEVENLVKHYPGVKAVDGISCAVHQEEIFGMVGPNGAGKTKTIECIEVACSLAWRSLARSS